MENTNWQPKWWADDKHGSAWNRVKEAMKRDWEQTKHDVGAGGHDLDQGANDTVKQATGKESIPPRTLANPTWSDVETPMRYGFGAREQYGAQHAHWNEKLENALKTEWEEAKGSTRRGWNDVKDHVRRGYDRSKS